MALMSNCIHVSTLGDYVLEDIQKKQQVSRCDSCASPGRNLWACLHYDCLYVGCQETPVDHSTLHFESNPEHCLTINLTSLRVWCYLCECEVFLKNNNPPIRSAVHTIQSPKVSVASADPDTDEENFDENHSLKPRGLTGLQNIGNTCYMNSAIQALSNCPPLTQFFLDCASVVRPEKKPGLSKSYLKLMTEMWHKKRPSYVVPSNIAYGIKMVCPMFRGYTQQDSQEFLRCFMDQLHEELKQPVLNLPNGVESTPSPMEFDQPDTDVQDSTEDSSLSEAEYETCDSGLSSEKSSCSEEAAIYSDDCPPSQQKLIANGNGKNVTARNKGFRGHRGGIGGSRERVRAIDQQRVQGHPRGQEHTYAVHSEGDHTADYSDAYSDTSGVCDSTAMLASRPTSPAFSIPDKTYSWQHMHSRPASTSAQIKNSFSNTSFDAAKFQSQPIVQQMQRSGTPMMSKSSRKKKQNKFRSIISDVFDGKILSSVQCLTCDRVSSTKETFQDLSLPIPNREYLGVLHASQNTPSKGTLSTCTDVYSHQGWLSWMFDWMKSWFWGPTVSLQDCLSAFFSADELKGDNMYSCEKCKKLRNGIKYSKVLYLPEILCIHLKRFRHEVMFSSKISSYVSFPLEGLDMQPFLHKECPSSVSTYDLVAVICHHGTAGGGHYTAYGLNYINDQWYEFDDQYVTEVDPQTVANCEAYVLFYRKASEAMMKKRQRAAELMDISKREPSLMQFYISKQWVNKFNTFAEPGPIDNSDFLCPHGGVHPSKVNHVDELCTVLSQGVWEYLHDSFRGGPPCTHLFLCGICQHELDLLESRRKQELEEFLRLQHEFMAQDSSTYIYLISMNWFRTWECFVKGKENDPPGPIDNSSIALNKNGQFVLKHGSDYAPFSEELWRFFLNIYSGGPQLMLHQGPNGGSGPIAGGDTNHPPASTSTGNCAAAPSSNCNGATVLPHGNVTNTRTAATVTPHAPPTEADPSDLPAQGKCEEMELDTRIVDDDSAPNRVEKDAEEQMMLS